MSAPTQAQENGTPETAPSPEQQSLLEQVIQKTEANIDVMTSEGLSALTRAEIDIQISTAKRYPRSLKTFLSRAVTMATLDQATAESCIYSLPRGGKPITGPSIRLAEIIASAWGNLRMAARVVAEETRFITAQGLCHDLEANNAITMNVQRRITQKNGNRYNDDMIVVTGNAAASIALRNAILRVIPRAYVNHVYEHARKVAIGDAKTITQRRAELIGYFGKMGITPERIAAAVEKPSIDDIDADDLLTLRGYANAIKDGQADIDETFPEPKKDPTARAADVKNRLNPPKKEEAEKPEQPQSAPPSSPSAERQPGEEDPEADADSMNRQDMIRDLEHRIDTADTEQDMQAIGADLTRHAEFLGDAHATILKRYQERFRKIKGGVVIPPKSKKEMF